MAKYDVFRSKLLNRKFKIISRRQKKISRSKILYIKPITWCLVKRSKSKKNLSDALIKIKFGWYMMAELLKLDTVGVQCKKDSVCNHQNHQTFLQHEHDESVGASE